MRLAAIICVWSDTCEFIPSCIKNLSSVADEIVVIWSIESNHFVRNDAVFRLALTEQFQGVHWVQHEPHKRLRPSINEIGKRNRGIEEARKLECTHFIILDGDEFYKPEELNKEKERFNPEVNGMVHPIKVFVGSPTLCCDDKNTLVPGIQKLTRDSKVGSFRKYPFAYDRFGIAKIDGTRRTNETSKVLMSDVYMFHYSYLRKDIDLKINNSSAKLKNRADLIKRDISKAKPGHVSELYHQTLIEVHNYFDIAI